MAMESFKKTFNKNSMKNVGKMFLFNFVQIENSALFWVFWVLFLITQPILSLTFYFTAENHMLDYSLIIILVPLVLGFIFSTILIYLLFQENKTNSIESKIICSKFTRSQVLFSRILLIWVSIFVNILGQDLFLVIYPIAEINKLGLALFISNTFITPFILMLYALILIFLTCRFSKVTYLVLSFLICIFTLGLSLITRPFINNESYMNYNKENSTYYVKLTDKNTNLILAETNDMFINGENNMQTAEEVINQINKKNWVNNLIFSEWTMSFYASLFTNMSFNLNVGNAAYNLIKINVTNDVNIKNIDFSSLYSIRPNDLDFTKLSDFNYNNVLFNDLVEISEKYQLKKNGIVFLEKLQNNFNWGDLKNSNENQDVYNFLIDATGINTKYNQLFYFIKYNQNLSYRVPNIYSSVAAHFNTDVAKLFKYVLTSDSTNFNLFKTNDVLKTGKSIDAYYPMVSIKVGHQPIIEIDKLFLKNKLIVFPKNPFNQNIMYLNSDEIYITDSTLLKKLQNISPTITSYKTWCDYIDSISINLKTTQDFLVKLQQEIPNLYSYVLSNNSIDFSKMIVMLQPYYAPQTMVSPLFISIYILIFIILAWLIKKQYKYAKIV